MADEIPHAGYALLSGSAGWGIRFPDDLNEAGVSVVQRGLAFETPWGVTDNWQLLEIDGSVTPDGESRRVLNVFSHGWRLDAIDHSIHRMVFWVLAQAGVRKILADATCGSLNRALQPTDFVIASDILDFSQTMYSTLPGRFKYMCRGKQLFCPSLGETLESTARALWPHRVYGLGSGLVTGQVWGPRFESPTEARAFQHLGCDAVNQSIGPEVTGAREIGACFISAAYVTNFVDGIVPGQWGPLDSAHEDLGGAAVRISLRTIVAADASDACGCASLRVPRPEKYRTVAQAG